MSENKLAGICFIVGAIFNFIPVIVGILLGGNPEEGAPILDFFYKSVIDGGAQSRLFAVMGALSSALIAYAIYTLNSIEQNKEKNALMGLGTFLAVFGSIGTSLAWCFDISMLFGANAAVGAATTASTGNFFLLQFGIWIAFGTVLSIGMAIFLWSLVSKGYASEEYGYWKPYFCSALSATNQADQYRRDTDEAKAIFWYERSIVLDPDDAINTFYKSGLKVMALDNQLLIK